MTVAALTHFGNARYKSFGSNLELKSLKLRVQSLTATTTSLRVRLPDARKVMQGGPIFWLVNSGSNSWTLEDQTGGTIVSVPGGKLCMVLCLDNSTSVGIWVGVVGDQQTVINEMVKTLVGTLNARSLFGGRLVVIPTSAFVGALNIRSSFGGVLNVTMATPTTNLVKHARPNGGNGTVGNEYNIQDAAALNAPGQTFWLRSTAGNYDSGNNDTIDTGSFPAMGGTPGNYKVFRAYPGDIPDIRVQWKIDGMHYFKCQGLKFTVDDDLTRWISATQFGADFIDLDRCTFTETNHTGQASGIYVVAGTNWRITNNVFLNWYGSSQGDRGDCIAFFSSNHILYEGNDATQILAQHSCISCENCEYVVIRRNLLSNRLARSLLQLQKNGIASYCLIEDNVIVDADYDGVDPFPNPTQEAGDGQDIRFMVPRSIFRNNVLIGHNIGTDNANDAAIQFHCFNAGSTNEIHRVFLYHNTIHKSKHNGASYTRNTGAGNTDVKDASDNEWLNNIISESETLAFKISKKQYSDFAFSIDQSKIWTVRANLFGDTAKTEIIGINTSTTTPDGEAGVTTYTVAQAEAAFPTVFSQNVQGNPSYKNLDAILTDFRANRSQYSVARLPEFFDAAQLNAGSPGKGSAALIARARTLNNNGTTLTLLRRSGNQGAYARAFSDGFGLIAADEIIIGNGSPVAIALIIDDNTIQLAAPRSWVANDPVYLAKAPAGSDCGVYGIGIAVPTTVVQLSGVLNAKSAFSGALTTGTEMFSGILNAKSAFAGVLTTMSTSLFTATHEVGDLTEYDSSVTDVGDLVVHTDAALVGTKGLKLLIDDQVSIYGEKQFNWTTQYLRYRYYIDPNAVTMSNSTNVTVFHLLDGATIRGRSRLVKDSGGNYAINAGVVNDANATQSTGDYVISDASHFVEIQIKRAANATSLDGHLKLWIDGTLKETVSGIDLFDKSRPNTLRYGAISVPVGMSGTFYLDDLKVIDQNLEIGA